MISANASNTSSSFTVIVGEEVFDALPMGWDKRGISGAYLRFSTTTYEIYDEGKHLRSVVEYTGKRDRIIIKYKGGEKVETQTSIFQPHNFRYEGETYSIVERVTGGLSIIHDGKVVAKGKCTFRSVVIKEYPENLEPIMPEMAVGFLIKMVLWSMFI